MSRHRNVRTMNYDEDYEGYDDVYGHSVEDDYPASPSVSQFIFDRSGSRAPQMSQFFDPENDIAEEPEEDGDVQKNRDVEKTRQRLDSLTLDSAVDEAVADLVPEEEILLKSCLNEIYDVVGDSYPDNVIIWHILHAKFNREKALDSLLRGVPADPTSISHLAKKMKPQPQPTIVKPQPLKPKDTGVKGSDNSVKPQQNGTTAVSLLEEIASNHYKKCTTNENAEQPSVNGGNYSNPLLSHHRTTKNDLKGNLFSTSTALSRGNDEKPVLAAVNNPLLSTVNPLLAPKIGSKPSLVSNPLMTSGINMLSPSLKAATNPLRAVGSGLDCFKSESTMDHSPTTLSRNPLFGGLKPTGFCTNPLTPAQNPISIPLLTPNSPFISPSNSLPSGTPDGGLSNPLLGLGKKPLIPRAMDMTCEIKPVEYNNNNIFPKAVDTKKLHTPVPLKSKILTRPNRFNQKPKYNYESAMATPRSKLAENITCYPVPLDNTPLDKNILKEMPSAVGSRFRRKNPPVPLESPYDENNITFRKVWMVMSEVLPEKVFKFNTPSPDALVGNASDFVATRAQDDSTLLNLQQLAVAATPMDIETKVFPVLESHNSTAKIKTKEKGKSKSLQNKKARSKSNGLRSKKK